MDMSCQAKTQLHTQTQTQTQKTRINRHADKHTLTIYAKMVQKEDSLFLKTTFYLDHLSVQLYLNI